MEYKVKSTHRSSRDRAEEMGFLEAGCLCIYQFRASSYCAAATCQGPGAVSPVSNLAGLVQNKCSSLCRPFPYNGENPGLRLPCSDPAFSPTSRFLVFWGGACIYVWGEAYVGMSPKTFNYVYYVCKSADRGERKWFSQVMRLGQQVETGNLGLAADLPDTVGQLTVACNSRFWGSDALFWSPCSQTNTRKLTKPFFSF